MKWKPEDRSCGECGFDWQIAVDSSIEVVETSPPTLRVTDASAWSRSTETGVWSPSEYLWHLVDVLRIGSERLWTITHDAGSPLVCWDENELALVRKYSQLSPLVAVVSFDDAVSTWLRAARAAPMDVQVEHDALVPPITGISPDLITEIPQL